MMRGPGPGKSVLTFSRIFVLCTYHSSRQGPSWKSPSKAQLSSLLVNVRDSHPFSRKSRRRVQSGYTYIYMQLYGCGWGSRLLSSPPKVLCLMLTNSSCPFSDQDGDCNRLSIRNRPVLFPHLPSPSRQNIASHYPTLDCPIFLLTITSLFAPLLKGIFYYDYEPPHYSVILTRQCSTYYLNVKFFLLLYFLTFNCMVQMNCQYYARAECIGIMVHNTAAES